MVGDLRLPPDKSLSCGILLSNVVESCLGVIEPRSWDFGQDSGGSLCQVYSLVSKNVKLCHATLFDSYSFGTVVDIFSHNFLEQRGRVLEDGQVLPHGRHQAEILECMVKTQLETPFEEYALGLAAVKGHPAPSTQDGIEISETERSNSHNASLPSDGIFITSERGTMEAHPSIIFPRPRASSS